MRFAYVLLCITAVVSPQIWGQQEIQQQLYRSIRLEQQGQYEAAIQSLQSIAGGNGISRVDQGRVSTLLGFAYKELGQFQPAQASFEKALNLLGGDAENRADLANALDLFAGFYQAQGQPQTAAKLWSKALQIFQQREDHRELAKTYANLAATALEQKHMHAAQAFFSKATAEMTPDMTDDDRAFISDIKGWIDDKAGHASDSVDDYQQALDFWMKRHGEEHPFTGWRYLLLGNAYAGEGKLNEAISTMRYGLTLMERSTGPQSPRYLTGEILYARVLARSGQRDEAAQLKSDATRQLSELFHRQCLDCTVSVWSLR